MPKLLLCLYQLKCAVTNSVLSTYTDIYMIRKKQEPVLNCLYLDIKVEISLRVTKI